MFAEPRATGPRPDLLWQFGGLDESVGTAAPDSLVAALGIPGTGEFPFVEVTAGSPPLTANFETPSGPVTAGAWRFAAAGHGMLGSRHQTSSYEPPVTPPFVPRSPSLDFENPTDLTHAQIAAFFTSRLENPHGTPVTPD